jgi:hypothetical protein
LRELLGLSDADIDRLEHDGVLVERRAARSLPTRDD